MRTIKTKTVSSNVYLKETVQNKNKSNSNLKNKSYSFDMKGQDADKNNKSEKSKYCFMNCTVLLEDAMKSKLMYHEPFKKTSETSDEQNKPKENLNFEVHKQMESTENRFETQNGKKTRNTMKTRSKACVDKPTEIPNKTSKKNKDRNSNKIKMKTVGPEKKQGSETTVEKSSNLPVNTDGKLPESTVFKVPGHKTTKTVSLNKNLNGTMQNKKKSNLKSHYLNKDTSNSFDMKGQDADKNNKSEKSKYCFMNCTVLLEDAMKSKLRYHEPFKKTSETSDEQNKPKENLNFELHKKIESTENRFETQNGKKTRNTMKTRSKACIDKPTVMPSKTLKQNRDRNLNKNNMKTVGPEEKQGTETIVEKSANLPVNKDGKLTESAKLEELNAYQASKNYTTATTVNIRHGRSTVMFDAYYQECDISNSNYCSHKRKLSNIKETIDNFLKRFKPS